MDRSTTTAHLLFWLYKLWTQLLVVMVKITVAYKCNATVATVCNAIAIDEGFRDSQDPDPTATVTCVTYQY